MKLFTLSFCICLLCVLPHVARAQDTESAANKNKNTDLCVKTARGPIQPSPDSHTPMATPAIQSMPPVARVGKPAPDFEANAFSDGGFRPIRLSEYKGKWVVLCFYPGDFTFV